MSLKLEIPKSCIVPDRIIPLEKLQADMVHIEGLLELRVDTSNMNEIAGVLEEISAWYSQATDIVASSKFYADIAYSIEYGSVYQAMKQNDIPAGMKGIVSPSVIKEYIASRNASFNYLAKKAERLHSSLTHRIKALISLLSKEKEVYRQHNMTSGLTT